MSWFYESAGRQIRPRGRRDPGRSGERRRRRGSDPGLACRHGGVAAVSGSLGRQRGRGDGGDGGRRHCGGAGRKRRKRQQRRRPGAAGRHAGGAAGRARLLHGMRPRADGGCPGAGARSPGLRRVQAGHAATAAGRRARAARCPALRRLLDSRRGHDPRRHHPVAGESGDRFSRDFRSHRRDDQPRGKRHGRVQRAARATGAERHHATALFRFSTRLRDVLRRPLRRDARAVDLRPARSGARTAARSLTAARCCARLPIC